MEEFSKKLVRFRMPSSSGMEVKCFQWWEDGREETLEVASVFVLFVEGCV